MATYIAKLTGNKRGIGTTTPMVLLINIVPGHEFNREHCWVKLTPAIEALMPAGHKKPIQVQIEAELKEYTRGDGSLEMTLDIQSIKHTK